MKKEETRASGRKTESERKALGMTGVWFPKATVRASFWAVASGLVTGHRLLETRGYLGEGATLLLS